MAKNLRTQKVHNNFVKNKGFETRFVHSKFKNFQKLELIGYEGNCEKT